jgi:hypothetical protein
MKLAKVGTFAIPVEVGGDKPLPTEFRLFKYGWNEAEHDSCRFDERAEQATMTAYQSHGVDKMIDLEHLSLDPRSLNFNPDAMGWCKLEVRNGELWAVGVEWTPEGADRLKCKKQRYISPAFIYDTENECRVEKLINVALTALPASHDMPALLSAVRPAAKDLRKLSVGPSFEDIRGKIQEALRDKLASFDFDMYVGPWVVEVFDKSVVYEFNGKLFECAYVFDGSTVVLGGPVEVTRNYAPVSQAMAAVRDKNIRAARLAATGASMSPEMIAALAAALELPEGSTLEDVIAAMAAKIKMVQDAAAIPPTPSEPPPPADAPAAPPVVPQEPSMAAANLLSITGRSSVSEAIAEVQRLRDIVLGMEAREAKLAQERQVLENGERRELVGKLVKLGVELPATAWSDKSGTVPVKRLQDEPISELRNRVAVLSVAKPMPKDPVPPPVVEQEEVPERVLASFRAKGLTGDALNSAVSNYKSNRAAMAAKKVGRS